MEQKLLKYKSIKYLQLKYSIIPLFLLGVFSYFFLDYPAEIYARSLSITTRHIFDVITFIGNSAWIIIITAFVIVISLIYKKLLSFKNSLCDKIYVAFPASVFILSSVIASGIVAQILKCIIGRARPVLFEQVGAHYFHHFNFFKYIYSSMPSGHSTTIGSLFACLLIMFPKYRYVWIPLAIFTAMTRVIVIKHYPSDVIFGLSLGMYVSFYIYNKFYEKTNSF